MKQDYFFEFKCAVCKKPICMMDKDRWAYKVVRGNGLQDYYCCSWSCLQKMPEKRKKGKKTNSRDVIWKMLTEGKGVQEIATEVGVTASAVKYWRDRM